MSKLTGVVADSSILSFHPEVSAAQRDSVLLAISAAEMVTRDAYEQGLIDDWFNYYRRQLMFYGYDPLQASEVHWPGGERPNIVDKALRSIAAASGGSEMALSMGGTLEALRGARDALAHFEQRVQKTGVFQLLPCAPGKAGQVDMVLYHESMALTQTRAGFLFRERQTRQVKAELVRFNVALFDQELRAKVEKMRQAGRMRNLGTFLV